MKVPISVRTAMPVTATARNNSLGSMAHLAHCEGRPDVKFTYVKSVPVANARILCSFFCVGRLVAIDVCRRQQGFARELFKDSSANPRRERLQKKAPDNAGAQGGEIVKINRGPRQDEHPIHRSGN